MSFGDFRQPSEFAQQHLYFTDGIGMQDNNDFYIKRKGFRNSLFMYVAEGRMTIEQNGKHQLNAGDFVVMRLSDSHEYYSDKEKGATIYWMHFGYQDKDGLLEYIEEKVGLPYIAKGEQTHKYLMECIELSGGHEENREYIYSEMVYKMLLSLGQLVNEHTTDVDVQSSSNFKKRVMSYVNQHIEAKPDLAEFAGACGFSKYHFIKVFKEHYECTPVNYLYKMKIEYSKNRLSYTNEPIGLIASDLGFESQSHFTRVFKQHVGINPSEHRRSI